MIYHYSTVLHLPFILASGVLLPSRRTAHGDHEHGLLWFSTNKTMERTALKAGVAMIRFAASDDVARDWMRIARAVGFSSGTMRRLEKSGRKVGAIPAQWRATVDVVPMESVAVIEVEASAGWRELDRDQLLPVVHGNSRAELFYRDQRVLIAARQRTIDGFYAYATNQASYAPALLEPGRLVKQAS